MEEEYDKSTDKLKRQKEHVEELKQQAINMSNFDRYHSSVKTRLEAINEMIKQNHSEIGWYIKGNTQMGIMGIDELRKSLDEKGLLSKHPFKDFADNLYRQNNLFHNSYSFVQTAADMLENALDKIYGLVASFDQGQQEIAKLKAQQDLFTVMHTTFEADRQKMVSAFVERVERKIQEFESRARLLEEALLKGQLIAPYMDDIKKNMEDIRKQTKERPFVDARQKEEKDIGDKPPVKKPAMPNIHEEQEPQPEDARKEPAAAANAPQSMRDKLIEQFFLKGELFKCKLCGNKFDSTAFGHHFRLHKDTQHMQMRDEWRDNYAIIRKEFGL